ncbi:TonB-dependent receptor plug domain-containing protein [Rubrivirga sp.]|uniref:TonB-dependent receptor plug domain-containing protein n=1 Tax=Rubrivirga sp. TaxID=1885344 RepID=UPI003B52F8A8
MRLRALLLLLLATAASAQPDRPAADSTLSAVTVTAARAPVATAEAASRVTVIDRAALDATGASTVADAIEARSAVFVKRYGPGGLASLSLRGTGAAQTLVLLDGHRIADPQLGQLDLGLLPAGVVEAVEVAHGAASALYGTDGIGGVVQVRTPDAGEPRARLDVRTGAWGERGGALLLAGGGPRLSAVVAVDHDESTGDYLYVDSTRFDPATQTVGVTAPRANADVRRDALFGRISGEAGRWRGTAGLLATDAERGLFAFSGVSQARQTDRALRLWTDHAVWLGRTRLRVGGLAQVASLRYFSPASGLDDIGRTRAGSLRIEADQAIRVAGGTWHLAVGAETRGGRAEHPSLTDDADETALAAFASAVGQHGILRVYPAVRADRVAAPTGETLAALSPQLGLNLRALPGLWLKASAGRAFRAPTFNDRFWQPGGDPGLRPERGWTADAGAATQTRWGLATLAAEATAFASALSDQIVWRPGRFEDGFYWAPRNVGTTQTRGAELSGRVRLDGGRTWLETGALATWTDARDRTDPQASSFDQRLAYVPDRLVRADLALGAGPLRLDAGLEHTGTRATASDGSTSLPPATVVDAGLSGRLRLGPAAAALAVRVENVLDARYAIVRQYPMPPRHVRVRLTLTSL